MVEESTTEMSVCLHASTALLLLDREKGFLPSSEHSSGKGLIAHVGWAKQGTEVAQMTG
jgi:hypothetical protein